LGPTSSTGVGPRAHFITILESTLQQKQQQQHSNKTNRFTFAKNLFSQKLHNLFHFNQLCVYFLTGIEHICNSNMFEASCANDEVIVVERAEYGRMETGWCRVTAEGGHIGCSNDILFLADAKCSGRRECNFLVGSSEFIDANTQCNRDRGAYMSISYSCVKGK